LYNTALINLRLSFLGDFLVISGYG